MRSKVAPFIDRDDIFRFLHANGEKPKEFQEVVDTALTEVFSVAVFRQVRKECTLVRKGDTLCLDGAIALPYRSLSHLFAGSTKVYVVCCTIGPEVMRRIRQKLLTQPADAVVLDACASVVADAYAAYLQSELPEETTMRFSPGYGDVPLALQRDLFSHLEIRKRIGVHLSEGDLMIPEKSVLFLAGNRPQETNGISCEDCGIDCSFRKEEK